MVDRNLAAKRGTWLGISRLACEGFVSSVVRTIRATRQVQHAPAGFNHSAKIVRRSSKSAAYVCHITVAHLAHHLASASRTPARFATYYKLRVSRNVSLDDRGKIRIRRHPRPRREVCDRNVYCARRVARLELRDGSHVQVDDLGIALH